MSAPACRCCGVALDPEHITATIRLCQACHTCSRIHGDQLQLRVAALVRSGQLPPYQGLAMMLFDDALLTGALALIEIPEAPGTARPWITRAPRRWEVVCGRAMAIGELPELSLVVEVTLARYVPGQATPERMQELANELSSALAFIDPDIISVDVGCTRDVLDSKHLIITINSKTATPGMVTTFEGAEVPDDILARPRGQA